MNLEIITKRKKELGYTSARLSKESGVPLGTINKILRGVTKSPQINTLSAICKVLNCNLNEVMSPSLNSRIYEQSPKMLRDNFDFNDYKSGALTDDDTTFRLLTLVKTGDFSQNDQPLEILANNAPSDCDFAVQMSDDSMEPHFKTGDILFAKKSNIIMSGCIGVFRIDGKIFVRKFESNMLKCPNASYPQMHITEVKFEKIEGIIQDSNEY